MSQTYYLKGFEERRVIFDYFFRKLPFKGGYAIFAGLEILLELLKDLQFEESDIEYLTKQKFDPRFLEYLKKFRFKGTIFSSLEGDIVFPTRPILTVEANIIEAQLIETLMLNLLNYQTLIATKASRMRRSAGDLTLIDFGMRRAHGPAAYYASRAAAIGGFDATSNVKAGKDFDIPVSGTMAHSFIQSFDDELSAFRYFAEVRPDDTVLLVDTYDTLRSGMPNAIKVGKEMESRGERLKGIRLDSGDLAYLAKQSRKMLDDAGMNYVKIAASNQLDEFVIKSLLDQNAPIDVFGVGTSLVTGQPDAALDGVYKLAFINGKPCIKLSENTAKITLPHKKQVYRMYNSNQESVGADVITFWDETDVESMHHPFDPQKAIKFNDCTKDPLLHMVMKNGERIEEPKSIKEIARFSSVRLNELQEEYKRFHNPHIYKVGLSNKLYEKRNELIRNHKRKLL
jgi:nicotinate phosphoribosyltransferase